jgi:hypothetical protein
MLRHEELLGMLLGVPRTVVLAGADQFRPGCLLKRG